jgi:hypothetical protein
MLDGRDHLWRFLPGAEWKRLPDCFKAPNRGRRLTPRKKVPVECLQCGKCVTRHRRSARYCSVECRRRAQLERDALRKGKALPMERVSGFQRWLNARSKGVRKLGSLDAHLRFIEEQERKRQALRDERQFQRLLSPASLEIDARRGETTPVLRPGASERRPRFAVRPHVLIGR